MGPDRFEVNPPFPVAGDVLVAHADVVTGPLPPGWSFDPEHRYWWHVVLPGEMWPLFDVLIFRLPTGMTDHDFN